MIVQNAWYLAADPASAVPLLFPNPADDQITVQLPDDAMVREFRLYDVAGRDLSGRVQVTAQTHTQLVLDLRALPGGAYCIRVDTGRGSWARRFVIR